MEEQQEERNIGKLLTLEYSEMTGEEIERVIEFKSDVKASERKHKESMDLKREELRKRIEERERLSEEITKEFNEYTSFIINKYKETL